MVIFKLKNIEIYKVGFALSQCEKSSVGYKSADNEKIKMLNGISFLLHIGTPSRDVNYGIIFFFLHICNKFRNQSH